MASAGFDKDVTSGDHEVAARTTSHDEPVALSPLEGVTTEKDIEFEKMDSEQRASRAAVSRTKSAYTDTSVEGMAEKPEGEEKRPKKWYKRMNPLKSSNKPPVPPEREVCREHSAGFFSLLTFQWMAPLMHVGYQRPLEPNDIWSVNPNRTAEVMKARLNVAFEKRKKAGGKRPLAMALYDTFKKEFWIGAVCQGMSSVLQAVSPFVLRFLISFAGEAYFARARGLPVPPIGRGVGLVILICVMQVCLTLCTNHFIYQGMMLGGEARGVLIAVIFDKAMRISGRAKAGGRALDAPPPDVEPGSEKERKWYQRKLKEKGAKGPKSADGKDKGVLGDGQGWGNGRIINLMSTDTYRVDQASGMFHMIWASPIMITITLALLIVNITYSALAGFALLVLAMPFLGKAMRSLFARREKINKITDQRVSLTQEILVAVRFVKFFGWESSFLSRISAIRKREIRLIQFLLAIRNAILSVGMSLPVFAAMLAFITYSYSNHDMNPAHIFSSLALFNALRLPLNFLPMVLGQVIDALSSLARIQEFLLAEDALDEAEWNYEGEDAVVMKGASFTWERTPTQEEEEKGKKVTPGKGPPSATKAKPDEKQKQKRSADKLDTSSSGSSMTEGEEPFAIHDINLAVKRNELIAVIGTVGSGKSSLLAALAGDMRRTAGHVTLGASRAFCPQYAWIQNSTVKDNIVFGKEFDRKWYEEVVEACALKPDLEMLPAGDLTEIGERGITVSGGQKQRLNIARAIYFDADIVLMDDPLSAVDAHVGRHIMDHAICGLLKDKCRILATHQLHVLARCDRIVWLQEGRVAAVDTFDNLMAGNADFAHLLATTAVEKKEEDEDEKEEEGVPKVDRKEASQKRKSKKKAAALMQAEERAVKSVSPKVYGAYIRASGSWLFLPLVLLLLVLSQAANIVTSLWLSWWTADKFNYSRGVYAGTYAAFGVVQALLMFGFSLCLTVTGTQAGKVMLHRAITRVLHAPMSFFDTTPLGRITNRFSKDIDIMDNNLTDSIRMFMLTMAMIIAVFILIIAYFHYFAIALGPLFILFLFSSAYYRASAREVKRHESVLRSHVFSRFGEAVLGTATIRAYGLQSTFSGTLARAIDDMNSAYFLTFANQRWLSVRLDAIGNLLILTTGILVVTSRFDIDPSTGGLVLSYILTIVQMIQFTIRQLAEVENNMNATERIHHYGTALEEEPPLHLPGAVPPAWPTAGAIAFNDISMRYRPGLPLVLSSFTLSVRAGERVAIVGRTGAGKSSIMSALFRLVELSAGSITIDGVDISTVGLHDLRSRLAIIPQDPTLFRGSVRSNLDPFGEHSDLDLWEALRQADLVHDEPEPDTAPPPAAAAAAANEAPSSPQHHHTNRPQRITLDSPVEESGLNFSLGQRQLMALARALARSARVIACDEATSSVDAATDARVQRTMATAFGGRTVLCVAHRLKTVLGYDRVVVMERGRVVEVGPPGELWAGGEGWFRGMCDRSGITEGDFVGLAEEGPVAVEGVGEK